MGWWCHVALYPLHLCLLLLLCSSSGACLPVVLWSHNSGEDTPFFRHFPEPFVTYFCTTTYDILHTSCQYKWFILIFWILAPFTLHSVTFNFVNDKESGFGEGRENISKVGDYLIFMKRILTGFILDHLEQNSAPDKTQIFMQNSR